MYRPGLWVEEPGLDIWVILFVVQPGEPSTEVPQLVKLKTIWISSRLAGKLFAVIKLLVVDSRFAGQGRND